MRGTPGGKHTAMLLLLLLGVLLLRACGAATMWLLCTLLLLLVVQASCREVLLCALTLQRSLLGPDMCCCHTKLPTCCTTEDGCTCMLRGGGEADTGVHAAADCCKQPAQRASRAVELDRY